ncbi:hypothetical protein RJT34_02751 [Clitoria ternatea]|uniref:Uncharacterized protein n=1 Tax=Clitoria ternatea TaxID=43366 RepID=A0AAN9KLM1_CLITE
MVKERDSDSGGKKKVIHFISFLCSFSGLWLPWYGKNSILSISLFDLFTSLSPPQLFHHFSLCLSQALFLEGFCR